MFRAALALLALLAAGTVPVRAQAPKAGDPGFAARLAGLAEADAALALARSELPDCTAGCLTPTEATLLAFEAGEGEARPGRFLLDIRGGGQSLGGTLGEMLFVNSQTDYATLGTLTIAFESPALRALLRRAKVCGAADVILGQITVKACRGPGPANLDMFAMMQLLGGRRIIVDGAVRWQWIDSALGSPRPVPNKRGEHEVGYYQVWVHVTDAAQVIFADEL